MYQCIYKALANQNIKKNERILNVNDFYVHILHREHLILQGINMRNEFITTVQYKQKLHLLDKHEMYPATHKINALTQSVVVFHLATTQNFIRLI